MKAAENLRPPRPSCHGLLLAALVFLWAAPILAIVAAFRPTRSKEIGLALRDLTEAIASNG